jgi:hypothetical protein
VTTSDDVVQKFLELVSGGIWKNLEIWVRKALAYGQQSLMGNSAGGSEDQNANRNVDNKDCAQETSGASEDSVGSCTRGHRCCVTMKNGFTLCHLQSLGKDELKGDGLIIWWRKFQGSPSCRL